MATKRAPTKTERVETERVELETMPTADELQAAIDVYLTACAMHREMYETMLARRRELVALLERLGLRIRD